MLKLLGSDDQTAATRASDIMAFETALAKVSQKLEDLRDPQRNYNKMSPGENIADYGGIMLGLDAFKKTDNTTKAKRSAV